MNKNLTYQQLFEKLQSMTPKQRQDNVSVCVANEDEFYPVKSIDTQDGDDVLDDGHIYLTTA